MRNMFGKAVHWLVDKADEAGIVGFTMGAILVASSLFSAYFAAPEVADKLDDPGKVPAVVKEHAAGSRGEGLELGELAGAIPSIYYPRPESFFEDRGIVYGFIPSPYWSQRNTTNIEAIMLHVTAGGSSAENIANYFKTNDRGVSAHFTVDKQGVVYQSVPLGDVAWHGGRYDKPDLANPLISSWYALGPSDGNPNKYTVGIETVMVVGERIEDYPLMQQSLVMLIQWISEETNLEISRDTVIGHYQVDSVSRNVDPRCCMNIDDIVRLAGEPATNFRGPVTVEGVRFGACNGHDLRWQTLLKTEDGSGAWAVPGMPLPFAPDYGKWVVTPGC